jgi:hypothetical protein
MPSRSIRRVPRWPVTVYRNPNTSEILPKDECPTLAEALCRPPTSNAQIIRNGELLAYAAQVDTVLGWILTDKGKEAAWEGTPCHYV